MNDGASKQAAGSRTGKQHESAGCAAGLTKDHYLRRVATKLSNVVAYPFESSNLVHVAVVSRPSIAAMTRKRRMANEAENSDSIGDGDDHSRTLFGEVRTDIQRIAGKFASRA